MTHPAAAPRVRVRGRAAVLVLPVVAWLIDAAGTLDIAARGGRCATDCTSGVVQLPFAPTLTPLSIVGVGYEGVLSAPAIVVAYAVVLALVVAWWWRVGGLIQRWSVTTAAGRRLPLPIALLALYASALVFTVAVKLPTLAVDDRLGLSWAVPVELGIWAALLWALTRAGPPAQRA